MLIDASSVASGTEFACDLCIVGAGPAGIAIADRLRESGLTIIIVESGSFEPEVANQRLYRGEINGSRYFRLDSCRYRLFGGSTNRWGGWCRPLDKVDFEKREWLPWSGWPITEQTLAPYYAETARLFELPHSQFDLATWQDRLASPFALDNTAFQNIIFQFSPGTNFGEAHGARLLAAPNITTLLRANLTQIELSPDSSRVGLLQIATLTGRKFAIRPRAAVLTTGGLENARLLLASQKDRPRGIGNENDLVGRFFMEHLHVPAGHMIPTPLARDRAFYRLANFNGAKVRGMITTTAAAMERHRLPATSIAIEAASYRYGTLYMSWPSRITYGPIRLYRRMRSGKLKGFAEAVKLNVERASTLPKRYRTWSRARVAGRQAEAITKSDPIYSLYFRAEQIPDPLNRVTLSERRDALGVPESRLDWRAGKADLDSITAWLDVFDKDLRAQRLGQVIHPAAGWEREVIGGPHHIGTTRMSADPRHGVVDEHCRVHSVQNLYVAGSSVFPTGGYANPTFTLVALALRLADTLRDRLRSEYSVRATT